MYTYGVSNQSSVNDMYKLMKQLSSGKRINSAADDAAGLAIAQKMGTQQTTYSVTNRNIADSQSFLNTADGGLSTTADSLQRIRELATQASNGTYSETDRAVIQSEIDQLKQQIGATSQNTNFNGLSTLGGGQFSLSGSSGSSTSFDASLKALGIENLDVTKNIDLGAIDSAIQKVSSMRGDAGAKTNAMTHETNANSIAELNITQARSRIEDADMAKMIMDFKNSQLMNRAGIYTQKQAQSTMNANAGRFIDMLV